MRPSLESLSNVRNPRHTGENRCLPCTVVNVVIAAALAAVIGLAITPLAGIGAFTVFGTAIGLRGYLVPGTPALTRELLPDWVLSRFGKPPKNRTIGDTEIDWNALAAAGLLEGPPSDRLRLSASLREHMTRSASARLHSPPSDEEIAEVIGGDVRRVDELAVSVDGSRRLRWPSKAALATDIAAADRIRERASDWTTLEAGDRCELLERVRLLLEDCPACGGAVERTVEHDEQCCLRPTTVVTAVCSECNAPIAKRSVPTAESTSPEFEGPTNEK